MDKAIDGADMYGFGSSLRRNLGGDDELNPCSGVNLTKSSIVLQLFSFQYEVDEPDRLIICPVDHFCFQCHQE